jgi:hypothetical protein
MRIVGLTRYVTEFWVIWRSNFAASIAHPRGFFSALQR